MVGGGRKDRGEMRGKNEVRIKKMEFSSRKLTDIPTDVGHAFQVLQLTIRRTHQGKPLRGAFICIKIRVLRVELECFIF